jgi:tyrosine-protein kinase Etk/Wzc
MEKQSLSSPSSVDGIDLEKLGIIFRRNVFGTVLILILSVLSAYIYLRYTKNVYQADSELKLDVKQEATVLNINSFQEEENLNIIAGEIEQIKSKFFLSRVIDSLHLDVSYYVKGQVLNDEMYKRSPFLVEYKLRDRSIVDVPVYIKFKDPSTFKVKIDENGKSADGKFDSPLTIGALEVIIRKTPAFASNNDQDYYFMINSKTQLLNLFIKNITVVPLNFNANTIKISFKDFNQQKAQDIVNKVDSLYLYYSYEQKNLTNKQKIEWLNNELRQVEGKMEGFEDYFENFTIQNKTSNLDEELKRTISLINKMDSQRFDLNKKLGDLNIVIDKLSSGDPNLFITQKQFLPAHLNQQVEQLQKMIWDKERLGLSYNEKTFAFRQKEKELDNLKNQVFSQLSDIKKDWLKWLLEISQRKEKLEKEFASMPDKNTQLSKNKRFYKLYEEFYLSMMQSKAEFEIAQAGSTPDFKILSSATYPKNPISPQQAIVMGIGLVAGIVLNFFFIGFLYVANNKITSVHEVEKSISVPLLGIIPSSNHSTITPFHILDNPKSMVSEAIRILRTNLDFFTTGGTKKVISISSTVSGEGKSFLALNLGGVLALSKKKVVLLDLDMRKHKDKLPFNDGKDGKGISTILIKKHQWQDCIVPTSLEYFDYLPSGPYPPNPSELLLNGEFTDLLESIKKEYDYVVIDTPPVGLVTDGIMAMKRSDLSIYVFRANYSKKDFLNNLQRIVKINKLERVAVVLNAMPASRQKYGYGYYEDHTAVKKRWRNLFR